MDRRHAMLAAIVQLMYDAVITDQYELDEHTQYDYDEDNAANLTLSVMGYLTLILS